jgi:hypothetical protein
MKKAMLVFLVILSISLVLVFCYLFYKTWNIFGFWTLMFSGLLSIISSAFLGNLIGSRSENNGLIIYNPKEWPKFINILVSLAIGYYLYSILSSKIISSYDYNFGMAYLILLTALPIVFALYKLIRDRNDFISISETNLKYKDNSETGDFKFTDINNAELMGGIKLTFKDSSVVIIKTAKMNFNAKDLLGVYNDIKAKLPEIDVISIKDLTEEQKD